MSFLESTAIEPGSSPAAAPCALARVLVIDDEEIVGNTLRALLKAGGFDAVTAQSGKEAVELLRGRPFDVAIADLMMPGMNGIQTIAALKEVDPEIEVMILTGNATVNATIAALRQGAGDFLLKPVSMVELRPALLRAMAKRHSNHTLPLTEAAPVEARSRAVIAEDIAQRKQAEEELRLNQFSIEHASDAIMWTDSQGRIVYVNEAACRSLGRSREELLSITVSDIDPDFPPEVWEKSWEGVKAAGSVTFEARHITKVGRVFPVEVTANYVEFGGKEYSFVFSRDITQRKEAERQINLQITALNAAANGIVITDQKGEILWANPAFTRLTGYHSFEVMGKNPRLLKSGAQDSAFYQDIWKTIVAGEVWQGELVNRRKDGTLYTEEMTITPVHDRSGAASHFIAIKQDITERKQVEQALGQERDLLRALMEYVPDFIYFKDRESRFLRISAALAKRFEFSDPAQALGKTDFDFYAAEHAQPAFDDEQRVINTGQPMAPKEEKETWPDGRVTWASTTKLPLRDALGNIVGTFGISRDITERNRAEEALRESEQGLAAAQRIAHIGSWSWNVQTDTARWSDETFRIFGLTPGQLGDHRRVFLDRIHPEDRTRVDQSLTDALNGTREYDLDYRIRLADGTEKVIHGQAEVLKDEVGKPLGLRGVTHDITERKRTEEELYQSRQMLQSILDSIPQRVFWKDRKLAYLGCNRAFALDAGLSTPAEIIGKNDFELAWKESAELYRAADKLVMEQESAKLNFEERQLRADGSSFWLRTNKLPFRDREGKVIGVVGTYEDITENKRAEAALQESEQRYRLLFSQMLVGFALLEVIGDENGIPIDHRYLEINTAFEQHTGLARDSVVGRTIREVLPGIEPFWIETYGKVATTGESVHFEAYAQPIQRWFEVTAFRLRPGRVAVTFADVTERRRAEQVLEERTVYLNTLFEISPMGIVVLDTEGHIQMSNSVFEQLFRYSRQEIMGTKLDDFIVPTELASEAKSLMALCTNGPGASFTSRRRRKDGTLVDVDIYGVPLIIEGELRGVLTLFQDITERKRAEADLMRYAEDLEVSQAAQEEHAKELARLVEELARERDLFGTLMDNLPDFIFYKDRQSRLLRTNPAHARVLGLKDPREAVGKRDLDFFPAEDASGYMRDEQQVIETGQPLIGRIEKVRHPDGQYRWYLTSKVPIRDNQGRITGLVGISRDMTDRMEAEETMRASEERYRELFENASDLVYTTDLEAHMTSLNHVGQRILGYSQEEATQLDLWHLVDPKHWDRVKQGRQRLLAGESDVAVEVEVSTKDGRQMLLEVRPRLIYRGGKPVGVQGIGRDITGRDAAEMELRHAQKLESVGRLASGIAHEINTPIQFVGDNTRFLQDSFGGLQTLLTQYQELREAADSGQVSSELLAKVHDVEEEADCAYLLEEIPQALAQTLDGVTRVATIVRAMKEFAHPEGKEMAAADINKALLSTLTVARNELKYVADVETEFGDLPLVVCNIGDINQVFLNLLVNAAHAIAEGTKGSGEKGKIQVRTSSEGNAVLVTISDTGCGIPEANRSKVFDPFFTTKEVGRGTGQGLAIARSVVVERHKGSLNFESEVGKGTTFCIRLPIDPGECPKEVKPP